MKCPKCNVWTSVNDTRDKEGHTVRRRECANGHRFTTEERPTPILNTKKPKEK